MASISYFDFGRYFLVILCSVALKFATAGLTRFRVLREPRHFFLISGMEGDGHGHWHRWAGLSLLRSASESRSSFFRQSLSVGCQGLRILSKSGVESWAAGVLNGSDVGQKDMTRHEGSRPFNQAPFWFLPVHPCDIDADCLSVARSHVPLGRGSLHGNAVLAWTSRGILPPPVASQARWKERPFGVAPTWSMVG